MVEEPGEINGACSPALNLGGGWVHPVGMIRRACALLALVLLAPGPARAQEGAPADEAAVRQLNSDYVRAFLACDVARFRTLLADDFTGVLADGRVIDKAAFLLLARDNLDAHDLRLHDLVIRPYGDAVLVGAVVAYARAGGAPVRTRYSSLYVRRDGRWAIVWTQWTRVVAP
jgi:ketosteroid isomerase-like protein